jgi:hypothetical protein
MNTATIARTHTNVKNEENNLLWRWEQFQYGYNLFQAGEQISRCQNAEQRRGFMAALNAQAEANTPGYAQKFGW